MFKQVVFFVSAVAVAMALGDGRAFHSKKNVYQKQGQYASVASYHSSQPQAQAQVQAQAAPSPYSFNYEAEGSARQESSDASGKVTGSYSVTNEDGSVRIVKYVADENGFRADIDTNEAGTKSSNPANVALKSAFVEPAAPSGPAPKKYATPQAHSTSQAQYEQKPIEYKSAGGNSAYSFNYDTQLGDGGSSSRSESSDESGQVTGRYSLSVADGRRRQVDYSSGHDGFQAKIDTNEFGTKSESPAHVQFYSSAAQNAPAAASFSKTNYQQQKQTGAFSTSSIKQQSIQTNGFSTSPVPVKQQPIKTSSFNTSPVKQQPIQDYSQHNQKPSPYSFSYDAQLEDGSSSRTESSDASGKVVGSYSLSGADGRKRTIDYEADHLGFRASVNTNEFGTRSDSPADVQFYSNAPQDAPADQYSQKKIPAAFPVEQQPLGSGSQFKSTYQGQSAVQSNQAASIASYAPYNFNYDAQLDDGSSSRSESGDGSGKVSGSYSLAVDDGRKRTVDYSADQAGFRATVNTNEFGTRSDSPADVQFYSTAVLDAPGPVQAYKASAVNSKASFQPAPSASSAYKASFATQQRVEAQPSYQPSPYSFGYEAEATGGSSARSESSDSNGKVTGSYTVRNEDGSLRVVDYVADQDGFRANVKTNEPGTKSDHPADVMFKSDAPAPIHQQRQQTSQANFPARTYTQKSSMVSQKAVDGWRR